RKSGPYSGATAWHRSHRTPGAGGVGPKTAADVLRQYGSLAEALKAGRFSAEADKLRLYREIAQMDAKAPLPRLTAHKPDWAGAAAAGQALRLGGRAGQLQRPGAR